MFCVGECTRHAPNMIKTGLRPKIGRTHPCKRTYLSEARTEYSVLLLRHCCGELSDLNRRTVCGSTAVAEPETAARRCPY